MDDVLIQMVSDLIGPSLTPVHHSLGQAKQRSPLRNLSWLTTRVKFGIDCQSPKRNRSLRYRRSLTSSSGSWVRCDGAILSRCALKLHGAFLRKPNSLHALVNHLPASMCSLDGTNQVMVVALPTPVPEPPSRCVRDRLSSHRLGQRRRRWESLPKVGGVRLPNHLEN
jgi:hypothetical protein